MVEPQPKAVPRKILSILKPTNKYWGTGPARPVQDQRGHRSCSLSKYIGKKQCQSIRKRPPLKGKKNKRHEKIETDWKTYTSSSNELNKDLETLGKGSFKFEILRWCDSKWELSYYEARLQFDEEVLLRNDYYNGIINVRIGGRK